MASPQELHRQAERQARDELPALNMNLMETEALKQITEEDAADRVAYAEIRASYVRLCRIRREKAAIAERMKTGGRIRKRNHRSHAEHHQRIFDDYFGTPAVKEDGVIVKEAIPAWQSLQSFYRRFRMGAILFSKLLFEIQHKETGHPEFREKRDARGVLGPTALSRLTVVIRILAYGIPFDAVQEYTGVIENIARICTYAFCDWLAAKYAHIHLGVWTPEAIDIELAINADRGFAGMLGSIDCTHWI